MDYLNHEFVSSLIYRHRDEDTHALYLNYFGFPSNPEPFPLFITKYKSTHPAIHPAIDRFLQHISDQVLLSERNILLMLANLEWASKNTFEYIHSQIQFLLPTNFSVHLIDLGESKPSSSWLLKKLMESSGIKQYAKKDVKNLEIFRRFLEYQWTEYKQKHYFFLFRADNLSFPQLQSLTRVSITEPRNRQRYLSFLLLEGTKKLYQNLLRIRKKTLTNLIYDTYFITHRGSLMTTQENLTSTLGRPSEEFIIPQLFEQICLLSSAPEDIPVIPLFHSIFYRMFVHKISKLTDERAFEMIMDEIRKENELFVKKSPEYKNRMENRDFLFPPPMLRNGPSITEARRFFEWMKWEA